MDLGILDGIQLKNGFSVSVPILDYCLSSVHSRYVVKYSLFDFKEKMTIVSFVMIGSSDLANTPVTSNVRCFCK